MSTNPKVLLLDEPASGMSEETTEMIQFILNVKKDFDLTISFDWTHLRVVMGILRTDTSFDSGETIAKGTPKEFNNDQKVIDAFLGRANMLKIDNLIVFTVVCMH